MQDPQSRREEGVGVQQLPPHGAFHIQRPSNSMKIAQTINKNMAEKSHFISFTCEGRNTRGDLYFPVTDFPFPVMTLKLTERGCECLSAADRGGGEGGNRVISSRRFLLL